MDVVYVVGPKKPELRYSLRSLKNLLHGEVWVVGTKPDWALVNHLPAPEKGKKAQNIVDALLAAAECPDISDEFAYFNDDFFALKPTTVPMWHRGKLKPQAPKLNRSRGMTWRESAAATAWLLNKWGIDPVLSYEPHVPMVFRKDKLAEVLHRSNGSKVKGYQARTLYGNYWQVGGRLHRDVKVGNVKDSWSDDWEWVSTSDRSFDRGNAGRRLRELFPDPSPYEKEA